MYYICDKKVQTLDTLYGIRDSKDGVIEYYTAKDIIRFVKAKKIQIEGVSQNSVTGKWTIAVKLDGFAEESLVIDTDDTDDALERELRRKLSTEDAKHIAEEVFIHAKFIALALAKNKRGLNTNFVYLVDEKKFKDFCGEVRIEKIGFSINKGSCVSFSGLKPNKMFVCNKDNAVFTVDMNFKEVGDNAYATLTLEYKLGKDVYSLYWRDNLFGSDDTVQKIKDCVIPFTKDTIIMSGDFDSIYAHVASKIADYNSPENWKYTTITNDSEEMVKLRELTKVVCEFIGAKYEDARIESELSNSKFADLEPVDIESRGMDLLKPFKIRERFILLVSISKAGVTSNVGYCIPDDTAMVVFADKKAEKAMKDFTFVPKPYDELLEVLKSRLNK